MHRELTRAVLFDLVWARPIIKLAADFGLSDVALHKICKKHRVPTPGRGYWAKLAAGKPVRRARLPEIEDKALDRVILRGAPASPMPQQTVETSERAEAGGEKSAAPAPMLDPEAGARLIEHMRKMLARAKPGFSGLVQVAGRKLISIAVAPASAERALRILEDLIDRAGASGHAGERRDAGAGLLVDGEFISLAITEKLDKVRHQPTEKEKRALLRWELERKSRLRGGLWVSEWNKPFIPEWDEVPSGLLALEIDRGNRWDGLRRKFADGKRQRLEKITDAVLAGAATCAAAIKAKREEAERRSREWKEIETRRRREQAFEAREERCMAFVEAVHEQLVLRAKLSAVLAHLESDTSEDTRQTEAIAAWLRRRLRQIDALISPCFLDISARSSKVDFEEPEDDTGSANAFYSCLSGVALHYWSIDEEEDMARSKSARDWLIETGLIPAPKEDPPE